MGQTILCELLNEWEDEDGNPPNPDKPMPNLAEHGFDRLYALLKECQETMFQLGTTCNEQKRELRQIRNGVRYYS